MVDPATEQEARERRRGKHSSTCDGYNERPCDCGLVDRIEKERDDLRAALTEALEMARARCEQLDALSDKIWTHCRAGKGARPSVVRSYAGALPSRFCDIARIAELRAKFLGR